MTEPRPTSLRTSLGRVRHLGSAHSGTEHFWRLRLTSVALLPLSLAFMVIVISLLGRNHAAVVQVLGSPFVGIVMLLFIIATAYHMWLGMQVVIEDYVHEERWKVLALMSNTFFSFAVGLASLYAILRLSFGV
jgi:succinate dehydrogenase / fumarate reductase membrane anchor subunit